MEKRSCQNCKKDFVIEPEDFSFYEKMKVPPPTFCSDCRLVRRLVWRNERNLYKRPCSLCGKDMISIYDASYQYPVYCRGCWWSDKWDAMSYAQDYDFSRDFFSQFLDLFHKVPLVSLYIGGTQVNSDYTNFIANSRDCYLCFGGKDNERIAYCKNASFSKESYDILSGDQLELCYEVIDCEKCYKLFYGQQCVNCADSMFLYDCRNCQDCFGCTNLRNKSCCIFNEQYTKEEYSKRLEELRKAENFQKAYSDFKNLKEKSIHKYANFTNAKDSTGDNLSNVRNCEHCFDVFGNGSENSKYTHYVVLGVKDSYDNYGMPTAERLYETIAVGFECLENSDYLFDFFVKGGSRVSYSYNCVNCSDVFGCIGLRDKKYCILNKQYSKEKYEDLLPKVIKQMGEIKYADKRGITYGYGEFFPSEFSPFSYNETIAEEYFPLDDKEAEKKGYGWKNRMERNYKTDIRPENLPLEAKDTDDLAGKVIGCSHSGKCNEQCTEAFKIIPEELTFYKRMGLSLPRLCPNCRHFQRLARRNPMKLWHRKCMNEGCRNEFETSYAPERPEIVFCESCYNKAVY